MFASISGATEAIAAALQSPYIKTTKAKHIFSAIVSKDILGFHENLYFMSSGSVVLSRICLHPCKEPQKQTWQHYKVLI